jgi:hypothetical protein
MLFWSKKRIIDELKDGVAKAINKDMFYSEKASKDINKFLMNEIVNLHTNYGIDGMFEEINKKIDEKFKEVERLERIIKYARDDKPTFNLKQRSQNTRIYDKSYTYDLYIYIDKGEYVVELPDLVGYNIQEDDCYFEVREKLVYFNASSCESTLPGDNNCTKYEFIIDYMDDRYIVNRKYKFKKMY